MKNTTTKIIENRRKDFDNIFTDFNGISIYNGHKVVRNATTEEMKSHMNATLIAVAKSELERLQKCKNISGDKGNIDGYMYAIQDQIHHWNGVLKDLVFIELFKSIKNYQKRNNLTK